MNNLSVKAQKAIKLEYKDVEVLTPADLLKDKLRVDYAQKIYSYKNDKEYLLFYFYDLTEEKHVKCFVGYNTALAKDFRFNDVYGITVVIVEQKNEKGTFYLFE